MKKTSKSPFKRLWITNPYFLREEVRTSPIRKEKINLTAKKKTPKMKNLIAMTILRMKTVQN